MNFESRFLLPDVPPFTWLIWTVYASFRKPRLRLKLSTGAKCQDQEQVVHSSRTAQEGTLSSVERKAFARRSNFVMRFKTLMSGTYNLNQSLYAPLTRIALVCPTEMLFLSSGHELPFSLEVRAIDQ
jgi:hypothetical protein